MIFLKTKNNFPIRPDLFKYYGFVLILFVIGSGLTLAYLSKFPTLLSMDLLSFVFGLQHAFDIDHISVIDNITRKMINDGKNTHGIGFCFSLGHSLVVICMAVVTIFFVEISKTLIPKLQTIGGIIGASFAGMMLILLAIINTVILLNTWQDFKGINKNKFSMKKTRIYLYFEKTLHLINNNWQVIGIGFLFGLGFDTATQISVLATSTVSTSEGIPWYAALSFPLLFTSGMCFMDTSDGLFMSTAYSWVFASPLRKIYYNLVLTGLSVAAAIFSGVINLLSALKLAFHVNNGVTTWADNLNFSNLGIGLVTIFVVVWGLAIFGWYYLGLNRKDDVSN